MDMGKGRHSEGELYHFLFNASSDFLAIQNFHNEILDINEVGAAKLGYHLDELLGKPISLIQKKYSSEELESITQKLMEKGYAKFESLFICKDGTYIPVEVIAKVIDYRGSQAVFTQSRDISQLKESEQKVALKHQESLKIFNSLDGIVYVSDPSSFEILFANQELIDSLGAEESIVGMKCYKVLQGLDSPCPFCTNHIIFNKKNKDSYVWEFQNRQNNHWYRCSDRVIEWFDGKKARLELAVDITDQVLATQALKESEERYKLATVASESGIWDWWIGDNSVFYSDQWKQLLGYKSHELVNEFSTWEDLLHPDDKEWMINTVQSFIQSPKSFFIEEFRMKHKDGTYRWIHNKASAVLDKKGKVLRMFGAHTDITDEKRTINQLIKSKEDYKQLFEQAHDAILIFNPENEVILDANKGACEEYGYSYDEFIGKSITQFSKNPEIGKNRVDKTIEDGVFIGFETIQFHKDGTELYFEINASLINYQGKTAILSINRNITERKMAEKALIDSKANLMSVLESSQDAIWSVDRENKLLTINTRFKNDFYYNFGVNLKKGDCIVDFVPAELGVKWKERYQRVFQGESVVEIDQFEIEKKQYYFEITINPIVNGQYISGASIVSKDITEREITRQLLLFSKNQAEENNRLKSSFLANMSHEIRTPMNGIMGFADLLKEEDLSDKEKSLYISVIERSGGKMLRLINNIIDISRVESGQMSIELGEVNVNELLNFQYAFFLPEAERNGLSLRLDTSNNGDIFIWSEATKIADIFTNLIKNSIKYTKEGEIIFGYTINNKNISFYVKDTGIGISEPKQKHIFERFAQAEKVENKVTEGAGLGLAITKAYVELLGGSIELKSKQHLGTEFAFTLPIKGK